jgi:chorismate lyase/3-hydroxybenzoate synthase
MERYRQFSVGRTLAFREFGLTDEIAPTGTGIGTLRKQGLTMVALSSHADVRLSENPRQISAFNYPRQYGPHSPKFGRGGSVTTRDVNVYLISGTASIIGHESVHISDTIAQFEETMRNLDAVYDAISRSNKDQPNIVLDHRSALRVYLRNPDDYTTISDRLRNRLGPDADQIAYLHAHICRKELTLEIDGVCAQ